MNIHNHTGCRYPASTHSARAVGGGPQNWVALAFVLCVCRGWWLSGVGGEVNKKKKKHQGVGGQTGKGRIFISLAGERDSICIYMYAPQCLTKWPTRVYFKT